MVSSSKSIVSVRNLTKRFSASVVAVADVSLDVREGEFFALVGPSGCGKTTLLRMLAGFEVPTEGALLIDGTDMTEVAPSQRPVNMVFQSYAVFPHMTVAQNVAYGLKVTGTPKAEINDRVEGALRLVLLEGLGQRKPNQLSGGQRQRVALARALVKRPKVLLLDEPLSALDAKLREAMQLELVRLQHSVGITFVIVTHDQDEALSMADRVAVMDAGRVLQLAPPAELYEYPNCRFVADFIGKMNLLEADVVGTANGKIVVQIEGLSADGAPGRLTLHHGGEARGRIGIAVRPEKVRLSATAPEDGAVKIKGKVTDVAYYGDESHVFLDNATGVSFAASMQNEVRQTNSRVAVGEELWISWNASDTLVLTS